MQNKFKSPDPESYDDDQVYNDDCDDYSDIGCKDDGLVSTGNGMAEDWSINRDQGADAEGCDMFGEPKVGMEVAELAEEDEEHRGQEPTKATGEEVGPQIEDIGQDIAQQQGKHVQVRESQKEEKVDTKIAMKRGRKKKLLAKIKNKPEKTKAKKVITYASLFEKKKKTNMPKFFIKLFRRLKSQPTLAQTQHTRNRLEQTLLKIRRIEKEKHIGTHHMEAFFGDGRPENRLHRIMMKKKLSHDIYEGVLMNPDIKEENKFTYMEFWKTMESRLRADDSSLIGRVQSF